MKATLAAKPFPDLAADYKRSIIYYVLIRNDHNYYDVKRVAEAKEEMEAIEKELVSRALRVASTESKTTKP